MLTRARIASPTGGQQTPVFSQPANAILLTVDRTDANGNIGTGSVNIGNGIIVAPGQYTSAALVSMLTLSGTELAMRAPLEHAFKHPDGTSTQSIYVSRTADMAHGTQVWLCLNRAPTETRQNAVTPPDEPASYFMAQPMQACRALPHPYKLPTQVEVNGTIDGSQWAKEYAEWIENDDWTRYPGSMADGGGRSALYCRTHALNSYALMSGRATFHAKALKLMVSGTGVNAWLPTMAAAAPNGAGPVVGFETLQDAIEVYLCALVSHSDNYLLALDGLLYWLGTSGGLLNTSYDGTYYNCRSGLERLAGRAGNAMCLLARTSRGVTLPESGGYGPQLVNTAWITTWAANMLNRVVAGTGESLDQNLAETGNLARATDTTKARLEALDQRDTVANLSVNITIGATDITIPAGATMVDNTTNRIVAVLLSWDGSAVVATPGTVTLDTGQAEPFAALIPGVPGGNRRIGHIVIKAASGTTYTANTTALTTWGSTVSGITTYYFSETRRLSTKPYMLGIALNALMQYVEWFPNDTHAATMLTRIGEMVNWAWTNCWAGADPTTPQFRYGSLVSTRNGRGDSNSTAGLSLTIDYRGLNTLMAQAMAWYGWKTNSQTWKDRAKLATDGAYTQAFVDAGGAGWSTQPYPGGSDPTPNHRAGDEAHAYLFHSLYYRQAP